MIDLATWDHIIIEYSSGTIYEANVAYFRVLQTTSFGRDDLIDTMKQMKEALTDELKIYCRI